MPPTIGAAIGFMTSEPMPDSQRIGTRLASTAHTVMSFGRKRSSGEGEQLAGNRGCFSYPEPHPISGALSQRQAQRNDLIPETLFDQLLLRATLFDRNEPCNEGIFVFSPEPCDSCIHGAALCPLQLGG